MLHIANYKIVKLSFFKHIKVHIVFKLDEIFNIDMGYLFWAHRFTSWYAFWVSIHRIMTEVITMFTQGVLFRMRNIWKIAYTYLVLKNSML